MHFFAVLNGMRKTEMGKICKHSKNVVIPVMAKLSFHKAYLRYKYRKDIMSQ